MCFVNRFPDHLSFISFSVCGSKVAMMRSVEDMLCKTNYGVSPDLMFCNPAIAQRWKFKHIDMLNLLANTFSTPLSHRQLTHQKSQAVFQFSTRYSLFSVRGHTSWAILRESRKIFHLFVVSRRCYAHHDVWLRHTIPIQGKFNVTNMYEWKTGFRMLWN